MHRDRQFYQAFKASSILGAAGALGTLIGLLRSKAFAIFLGAGGVGLAGLYSSLIQVASTIACLGVNVSLTRELSHDGRSEADRDHARVAGILFAVLTGVLCGAAIWVFRVEIATWIVADPARAGDVGLLSVGAGAQISVLIFTAILQGYRRLRDIAFYNIVGSLPGTITAIVLAAWWQMDAVHVIAICLPLSALGVGLVYMRRLPRCQGPVSPLRLIGLIRHLVAVGVVLMFSAVLQQGAMLYLRAHVTAESGLEAAGFFHAAWLISVIYIALVMQPQWSDFFPRLCGVIGEPVEANRALNQALLVVLLLVTPMVIGGIGGAWLVMIIFFSREFLPAEQLLMLFSVGNLFRAMSVTMAYVVLAKGWSTVYFALDVVWAIVFLSLSNLLYDRFGLEALGIGFIAGHAVHCLGTLLIVRRVIAFRAEKALRNAVLRAVVLCGVTGCAALVGDWEGLAVGFVAGLVALAWGASFILASVPREGRLGRLLTRLRLLRRDA
jgi:enterobacterial common antigen flippase